MIFGGMQTVNRIVQFCERRGEGNQICRDGWRFRNLTKN